MFRRRSFNVSIEEVVVKPFHNFFLRFGNLEVLQLDSVLVNFATALVLVPDLEVVSDSSKASVQQNGVVADKHFVGSHPQIVKWHLCDHLFVVVAVLPEEAFDEPLGAAVGAILELDVVYVAVVEHDGSAVEHQLAIVFGQQLFHCVLHVFQRLFHLLFGVRISLNFGIYQIQAFI